MNDYFGTIRFINAIPALFQDVGKSKTNHPLVKRAQEKIRPSPTVSTETEYRAV